MLLLVYLRIICQVKNNLEILLNMVLQDLVVLHLQLLVAQVFYYLTPKVKLE